MILQRKNQKNYNNDYNRNHYIENNEKQSNYHSHENREYQKKIKIK